MGSPKKAEFANLLKPRCQIQWPSRRCGHQKTIYPISCCLIDAPLEEHLSYASSLMLWVHGDVVEI